MKIKKSQQLIFIFSQFIRDVFLVSSALLLALVILEDLEAGFVSFHVSLGIILTACLASGIMTLLASRKSKENN